MQSARTKTIVMTGVVALFIVMGCASAARGVDGALPTCHNASGCNPGRVFCTFDDTTSFVGTTVISDRSAGVSGDGRGPFIEGTDGVLGSNVMRGFAGLGIRSPRKLTVNLSNPVPRGGGVPLGIITDGNDNSLPTLWFGVHTQWKRVGNAVQNLHNIPVGQTVMAAQMNVFFHIDGRFHILQMGPQAFGHCHAGTNRVSGTGTTSGTIYRASQTKWVMDVPAGSVGRLFDLSNTIEYAVDRGLYYLQLHFEIGH